MPSSLKNFWRKGKKNKSKDTTPVIEEARDEEVELRIQQSPVSAAATVKPPSAASGTPAPEVTPALSVHDESDEARDDAEQAQPENKEQEVGSNQPPEADDKGSTEKSQTQGVDNYSSESITNNNSEALTKKTQGSPAPYKPKKQRSAIKISSPRPPPINTYNNADEPNLSQAYENTYSQGSSESDTYSWNEYDSYHHHTQGNHIYIRDNESVSVLTKEFRDPNIMDVLSLDAVMEAVNKGIISREDGVELNSRLNGGARNGDENSDDGLWNSLWSALDCCGDNSSVAERSCYVNRCRPRRAVNGDSQYFGRREKMRSGVSAADSLVSLDRIQQNISDNRMNCEVSGKSVSWADDTVDNIVLDGSLNDGEVLNLDKDIEERSPAKRHFNISRSTSSDGKNSKASVRSAVKSGLKNVQSAVTNFQRVTKMSKPVDADTVYEQHRSAMMNAKGQPGENADKEETSDWRDRVNGSSDPNWRAGVTDRLNYQGPNSPASSAGRNLSPMQYGMLNGIPQWEHNANMRGMPPLSQMGNTLPSGHAHTAAAVPSMTMTRMPSGHHPGAASSPPMPLASRAPSMGNRSIVSNMVNMSMSVDSDDIGDKYGMEAEEVAMRPVTDYGIVNSMHYDRNTQYPSQQLAAQGSVMGRNDRYSENNAIDMNLQDPRINNIQGGPEDYSRRMSNVPPHAFQNVMGQPAYEDYGQVLPQQHMTYQPELTDGVIQHGQIVHSYNYQQQQQQQPSSPGLVSPPPQRTFMA